MSALKSLLPAIIINWRSFRVPVSIQRLRTKRRWKRGRLVHLRVSHELQNLFAVITTIIELCVQF